MVHICHGQGCQESLLQRPQGLVTVYSIIQTKISLRVKKALVITQVKRQNQDCSRQMDVWSVSTEQTAQSARQVGILSRGQVLLLMSSCSSLGALERQVLPSLSLLSGISG